MQIKKLFGDDFSRNDVYFPETEMRVRIVEIKNEFKNLDNPNYTGE